MGSNKELFYVKIVTTTSKRTYRILSAINGNCIRRTLMLIDKTIPINKVYGCIAELLNT
jgi:hypothetical protein